MNDGIKKGVAVYRKNKYGHLYNIFLVEGTRGDKILAKTLNGRKITLERNDFYPVKIPSLRISKEEFEIIRLIHANRKVYVMLESINRFFKNKIVESANGILTKQIFSIRCAIWNIIFE